MAVCGRVERAKATLEGVRLPSGLRVAQLRLEGEQFCFSHAPLSLEPAQPMKVEAEFTQEDLQAYVAACSPSKFVAPALTLGEGFINITATLRVVVRVTIRARLTVAVVRNQILRLNMAKSNLRSIVEPYVEGLNPVLDVASLPIPFELHEARVEPGRVVVIGATFARSS